jgi:predicted nucleic acid-binding protein
MIYLIDTTIIIDAINGKRNRPEQLEVLITKGNLLACCSINITEVYAGMRPGEEEATEQLLQSLKLYPVTFSIARLAGILKRDYSKKGKVLTVPDATIAAVAIHNDLPLITDNVKDFPMEELQLYPLSSH